MMFAIPWASPARLVRTNRPETELGTLRGCVRAWKGLNELSRADSHIVCGDAVFVDDWKIPLRDISAARIMDLTLLL